MPYTLLQYKDYFPKKYIYIYFIITLRVQRTVNEFVQLQQ